MSSLFFPVHGLVAGRSRRKTPTPGASSAAESRVLYQNRPTIATTNCKSAHVFRFFAAFSPKLKLASQPAPLGKRHHLGDRKSTRLNSSHVAISYAVFCLKKKKKNKPH